MTWRWFKTKFLHSWLCSQQKIALIKKLITCLLQIIHPNLRYLRGLDQSLYTGSCEGYADNVDSKLCHRSSNGHAFGPHLPCRRLPDEQLLTGGKCGRGAPHWP